MKFDQNHCTIVQGLVANFGATIKIHKKIQFGSESVQTSTQHKDMYVYQKKYKNGEFSPSHF